MTGASLDRWDAEVAVRRSALPAPSRLILHTLLTHVTNGTLTVPTEYSPSLTALVRETGLSRGGVAKHLNLLETEGWLKRRRPDTRDALKQQARTGYDICPPVHLVDPSTSLTSPPHGLPPKDSQVGASPPGGLVNEVDGGSPRGGLNPMSFPMSSSPTEKKTGTGTTKRRTSSSGEHPRFAEWYAAYPLRKERAAAVKAFAKAAAKADPDDLIAAAKRYHDDPQVRRGYTKNPATWLNKGCWLDEPAPGFAATGTDGRPEHGPLARVNDKWAPGQEIRL